MSKVIVERPRVGGNSIRKGREQNTPTDLLVSKEGMRAPHVRHYGGKELNENLAPLRRFLESCVGRPWNDIYSEISKNLRPDNTVQQHVRDHVWDFVERHTTVGDDGELYVNPRYGRGIIPIQDSYVRLYVDPRDGILRRNDSRSAWDKRRDLIKARQAEEATKQRTLKDGTELRKLDGIWYEVIMSEIPPETKVPVLNEEGEVVYHRTQGGSAWDFIKREFVKRVDHPVSGRYYRPRVTHYASGKRQLSSEELRRHGLENDRVK